MKKIICLLSTIVFLAGCDYKASSYKTKITEVKEEMIVDSGEFKIPPKSYNFEKMDHSIIK
jgi:hypothetical protein